MIHPFKMYNKMLLSVFTVFSNHDHNLSLDNFCSTQKKAHIH